MRHSSHKRRSIAAALLGAFYLGSAATTTAVSDLSGPGDFAQIAKNGFALTVDGAFYADDDKTLFPNLQPNLGSSHNNYSWSMAWYQGALWVGTNRDVTNIGLAGRDPAEIWRYTPSSYDEAGDWGLSGTWTRMYTSPNIKPLYAVLGGDQIPFGLPRDIGYRTMAVCNAGDQIDRLYVSSFGLPGGVLYYDGDEFQDTSNTGLFNNRRSLTREQILGIIEGFSGTSRDFSSIPIDLGYRGLACFRGRLVTAPAGRASDVDTPANPVVHINADPAHGAPWETLVNVADPDASPLADPDNLGVFQVATVGDRYIYLSVVNRTTGMELWRGDGVDCLEPWVGDGHCNIGWAKIIDNGAGRPPDQPMITPEVDNAGATLGVFGSDLYVGAAESGFIGITSSELIRIPNAGSEPPGGPDAVHTWQLVGGWPRLDFDQPDKRLPGLENLDCTDVADVANDKSELPPIVQAVWDGFAAAVEAQTGVSGVEPVGLDDDLADDDCLPASGAGPGLPSGAIKHPLTIGNASYLWRFAEHQGDLFIALLDYASGNGFDLIKSSNGIDFTTVFDNGLGNPNNVGGRSLVSTPVGLAVGTANVNVATALAGVGGSASDGTEVFIGTTAPGAAAAPKADAGPDQLVFDHAQTGTVDVILDATASTDSFGGGGLAPDPYEWFMGAVAADCTTLDGGEAFSAQSHPGLALSSMEGPNDIVPHTFTLRVTDIDGNVGCDQVSVTASYDLPPTVEVHTSVPYNSGVEPIQPGYPGFPTVKMIDFDGDDQESYDVDAVCKDDQAQLARCELVVIPPPANKFPVNQLSELSDTSTDGSLCTGLAECPVHARVTTPYKEVFSPYARGFDQPGTYLVAEDANGYQAAFRWNSITQPIKDTDGNDDPLCRNADLIMTAGVDTSIQIDPAAGDPPICIDPDGDPLSYGPKGTQPALGAADFNGVITYTPDDFTQPALDQLGFAAADPAAASSGETALRITIARDAVPPVVTIDFPEIQGEYRPLGYRLGCIKADICGTAFDAGIGLAGVEIAVERQHDGTWWDGRDFVPSAGPIWHAAEGTETWRYSGFTPTARGDYRAHARATDLEGNTAETSNDFSYSLTRLQQLLGRLLRF